MFQYVLALLLINTYYQSLGSVLPPVNPPTISSYLVTLAKDCNNKFVSEQIQNKIGDCNITSLPHKQQLHCLMFYDINKQLCSAIAAPKLVSNEDYAAKINETQDINVFCTSAKDFAFTNLTEYPFYKELAEKLFNTSVSCSKVCSFSDITNQDTKYYCKYFKWGFDTLRNQPTTPISHVSNNAGVSVPEVDTNNVDIPISSSNTHKLNPKPVNGHLKPVAPVTHIHDDVLSQTNVDQTGEANVRLAEADVDQTGLASVPKPIIKSQTPEEAVLNVDPNIDLNKDISSSTVTGVKDPNKNGSKPKLESDVLDPDTDGQGEQTGLGEQTGQVGQTGLKDTVIENPGHQKSEEEYTNDGSEDDKGEDEEIDNFGEKNIIPEPEKNIIEEKKTVDISPKGYTPTENEDFDEEGDNFFPFFLTAVVLVVLLYILYHNKNKVTKVFFGLILEGRQGGRRRNSRGHAYRRLDTLEQAMSAKTAMPPSKIIY